MPLDLIGETIVRADVENYLAGYQAAREGPHDPRGAEPLGFTRCDSP
jgi:hypothetical protein